MIRVRDIHKSYSAGATTTEVLRGVDLDVEKGEILSIVGPSGSGKTTLLHAIGGLDRAYTGTVEVDGRDLASMNDLALSRYRNETIGFVFQSFYLLPHLNCLENIALPAAFRRGTPLDAEQALARANLVLTQVGLADKAEALPTTLSGGQRQRIAIARALFNHPKVVLCDEPTGNLDRAMGTAIIELFRRLGDEDGLTIVIVTHDPTVAAKTPRTVQVADGTLTQLEDAARPAEDRP